MNFYQYCLKHNVELLHDDKKFIKMFAGKLTKDILEHYSPDVVRFFVLSTHYRSPLDFSDERLSEAQRSLARLRTAVENLNDLGKMENVENCERAEDLLKTVQQIKRDFYEAMDDDFNTALATSVMFGVAKEINKYYNAVKAGKAQYDTRNYLALKDAYFMMTDVIGILVQEQKGQVDANEELPGQLMDIIIEIRQHARQNKDWATSDKIRDSLGAVGIVLEDSPQGVRWKKR